MQQLKGRNIYTPTDIPHVRSNCDLLLNSPEGRDSVAGLKTSFNSPDAALTARGHAGQNLRVSVVYVLNKRNEPLMPCSPRKARVLLEGGKAKVAKRTPFTVQLKIATGQTKQAVNLGVDSGYSHVGLSAVSSTKELYAADLMLRNDLVKLNSERRTYRRARRHRKCWHRKPRFFNRKKHKGWLAPSIQNKLDTHLKAIAKVKEILPIAKITVEVAAFDIQKIRNPSISGKEYQDGPQKGFSNVREYVLYRDGHICQNCRGKSKDPILQVHHTISRQVDGDSPERQITLCRTCHKKVSQGKLHFKVKPSKGFRAETFMTMVRWRLVNILRKLGNDVVCTYGYQTKDRRRFLGLPKSHLNDAFVIAGGEKQVFSDGYLIKQVRKCNRKLFHGIRSHVRNTGPRFIRGFQRFDKVLYKELECFIWGRRKTGYFALKSLDGTKISGSINCKQMKLLESARTILIERRQALLSVLAEGSPSHN